MVASDLSLQSKIQNQQSSFINSSPNYSEARGAESRKDFFHKMHVRRAEIPVHKTWRLRQSARAVMSFGKALKWIACLAVMAALIGSASALFLWALDAATRQRFAAPWLIWLLPPAGVAMGFYYRHLGKHVSSGNHVILGNAHKDGPEVPFVLAPSILVATVVTHLFGGSAGREGTAVQMGAGIAAGFGKLFAGSRAAGKLLVCCGIAGGFGAVFGTPFAGAVFALEFVGNRVISPKLIPCLLTALAADFVCHAWGANHTSYPAIGYGHSPAGWLVIGFKLVLLAAVVALVCRLFVSGSHFTARKFREWFPHEAVRAGVGGVTVIALFLMADTTHYLGLGTLAENKDSLTLPGFLSAETHAPATAWLWKLVFTVVTLSAGFKGGEVTPLFFIGAALGNSLAWWLDAPVDLFAGVAMIALFAAATRTPVASVIMGMELLGWKIGVPLALCTFIAVKLGGSNSIYPKVKDL
jgi:H+/Cl- antiporter ClcA